MKNNKRKHKVSLENVKVKINKGGYDSSKVYTNEEDSYSDEKLSDLLIKGIPDGTYRVNINFELEEVDAVKITTDTDFVEIEEE